MKVKSLIGVQLGDGKEIEKGAVVEGRVAEYLLYTNRGVEVLEDEKVTNNETLKEVKIDLFGVTDNKEKSLKKNAKVIK